MAEMSVGQSVEKLVHKLVDCWVGKKDDATAAMWAALLVVVMVFDLVDESVSLKENDLVCW